MSELGLTVLLLVLIFGAQKKSQWKHRRELRGMTRQPLGLISNEQGGGSSDFYTIVNRELGRTYIVCRTCKLSQIAGGPIPFPHAPACQLVARGGIKVGAIKKIERKRVEVATFAPAGEQATPHPLGRAGGSVPATRNIYNRPVEKERIIL